MQSSNNERKLSPDSVRRRKTGKKSQKFFSESFDATGEVAQPDNVPSADDHSGTSTQHDCVKTSAQPSVEWRSVEHGTFWLTRIVLLRYLGFIYCEY